MHMPDEMEWQLYAGHNSLPQLPGYLSIALLPLPTVLHFSQAQKEIVTAYPESSCGDIDRALIGCVKLLLHCLQVGRTVVAGLDKQLVQPLWLQPVALSGTPYP